MGSVEGDSWEMGGSHEATLGQRHRFYKSPREGVWSRPGVSAKEDFGEGDFYAT